MPELVQIDPIKEHWMGPTVPVDRDMPGRAQSHIALLPGARRILYVQYTNPGCYPPLLHSARILADAGWDVHFLGTQSFGDSRLVRVESGPRIRVTQLSFSAESLVPGLHYLWFCLRVLFRALWWRPAWIYASDSFSSPPTLLASLLFRCGVIFHEHDTPVNKNTQFSRFLFWTRRRLARRANLNILPNQARAEAFERDTQASRVQVVWNCPSIKEVAPLENRDSFVLYYHGNISPNLVPLSAVEALKTLPEDVVLRILGYETQGSVGYSQQIMERAAVLGVAHRLQILPAVGRAELVTLCRKGDVGLAFFPEPTTPRNSYAGASNKVFDYLCCGLPIIISDNPEWNRFFAGTDVTVACDPADPNSISQTVLWFYRHRAELRSMGQEGRRKILAEWNYEKQFAPVLDILQGSPGRA
ncbi:MAG: glycosyltransferase [Acidobacteriia bacterium]|nr:glycosyltransferase [Terriglobia bacterium]